jgi:hypothetical protein
MRPKSLVLVLLVAGACAAGPAAPRAKAFNPIKPVCTVGGLISGIVGKACTVVEHGGRLLGAGKQVASGRLGSAVKTVLGQGASAVGSKATFALGLAAVVTWVLGGAKYALHETASVIGRTTAPRLQSTWFSATYWRVAGIAAVLTLPFLFAAAIQALVQSDLTLLIRAALGYLPLAMLCVGIAAQLTMLLLAASDQMSAIVSSAAGHASAHFLTRATAAIGAITLLARSPFLVFFVGLLTVGAAIALWFELLLRAAAVYVIVLMLPLAFAALVWPARRIWAIRAVEVLVALILSKFLIVAVLSLGGAALSESFLTSVTGMLAAFVLLVMGTLAPWALLRLLPLGEIAGGALGPLHTDAAGPGSRWLGRADGAGRGSHEWEATTAEMRRQAEDLHDFAGLDDGNRTTVERAPRTPVGAASPATASANGAQPERSDDSPAPAAGGGDSAASDTAPTAERSPGLAPIWQMDDFSWPTIPLGREGWPPTPITQTPNGDPTAGVDKTGSDSPATVRHPADRPDETSSAAAPAPEIHDPTPPPQPRDPSAE